jgi:hypothetical protein
VGKELLPDLEQADSALKEIDPLPGLGEVINIEGENNPIFWIFRDRMVHGISLRQWNSLTYIHIMKTLSTGNFHSKEFDISLLLCLNTGDKRGRVEKSFIKFTEEGKFFLL